MRNSYKSLILCLLITVISCSSQNTNPLSNETNKLSLGPTGGGTIDPKITAGQTIINYKRGFNNLVFNIKLISDSNFKTSDTSTTTSTNENKSENSVEKVTIELNVNGENLKFDVPKDKFSDNQHKINVTGLKDGDTINLESRVYDKNGKIVGSENIKNKKIDKEFETVDLNISLSINISNTNTQNVTVNQTQTVAGSNITINLPQPPAQNPPQPTSQIDNNCVRPSQPDGKLVLTDGSTVIVCPKPELRSTLNITSCIEPTSDFKINLPSGKVITLCPPLN